MTSYVRLSNTQVKQDFFRASQDGIKLLRPPEHFNVLAHTGSSETSAAKDLKRNADQRWTPGFEACA
jgi:hypothetical protein